MKRLISYIRDTWRILGESIYTGKRLEANLNALTLASVLSMLLGIVMILVDLKSGDPWMLTAAVATLVAGAGCGFHAGIRRDRERAILIPTLFCIVAFTIYTIQGTAEGSGMLWSLLLPIGISYFVSVKYGILLSAYYTIFFCVVFYTPLGAGVRHYYTEGFITRFPILYASVSLFTSTAMIQYHVASLKSLNYEADLTREVEALTRKETERRREVEEMGLQTVQTLASAIDAKDRYTNGHSFRVSEYASILAEAAGLDALEIETLRLEALLHDIGKIGIPDSILNKPGKLSDIEFHIIQSHTELGAKILTNVATLSGASDVALSHHERYNGKGYPNHLSGDEIPLHARIVGIADAYDAMNSDRVYRPALKREVIREELVKGRGTQFDPQLLDIFLELFDAGKVVASPNQADITTKQYDSLPLEALSREVQDVVGGLYEVGSEHSEHQLAVNYTDFMKTYDYVKAIALRYHLDFEMVMITVTPKEGTNPGPERQRIAASTLEQAIRRAAREVDTCAQCSDTQLLAVFLGTELPNVEKIMQRILTTYYKMFDGSDFTISWETAKE